MCSRRDGGRGTSEGWHVVHGQKVERLPCRHPRKIVYAEQVYAAKAASLKNYLTKHFLRITSHISACLPLQQLSKRRTNR